MCALGKDPTSLTMVESLKLCLAECFGASKFS